MQSGNLEMHAEALEDRRLLASWGAYPRLIEQDGAAAKYPQITGSGQAVAVIDTGVDYKHPALGGGFGPNFKVVAGYDFADNDADPMDEHGHGTGVAAAIAAKEYTFKDHRYRGVAPDAKIVALRVDDDSSAKVTNRRVESALRWVLNNRARYNIVAVNLSLGEGSYATATRREPYGDELDQLFNAGVFLAAASGNDGVSNPPAITYPAAHPNVYSVGAVNTRDVILDMTQRSRDLDLLAPGDRVPLPFYDGSKRKHIYLRATGTSFAAPFVAGAAALLKQVNPALRPQDILAILKFAGRNNYDGDAERSGTRLTFRRLDLKRAIQRVYGRYDDKREHNDTLASAATLALSGGSAQAGGMRLLAQDDDFYKFSLAAASRVSMNLTASGGGARFELFSAGGNRIADLGKGQTRNLIAGTYVLKVDAGLVGMSGSYTISVSASGVTPPVSDDGYEQNDTAAQAKFLDVEGGGVSARLNLRLLADDPDYFTFVLTKAMDATIEVAYNGSENFPAGQLLNSSQQSLTSLPSGTTQRRLQPGRHYLRFASPRTLSGTYRFTVRVKAIPEPEPEPEDVNAQFMSAAFDADGRLHVAYQEGGDRSLRYQTRSPSGVWSAVRTVDSSADVGRYISLAVDQFGAVGIAYYDSTNRNLKYARQSGASFTIVTVDSTGATGEYPSLAYDSSGRAHIAYYHRSAGDLRLAVISGGGWSIETIDDAGDTGLYTSLGIDSRGVIGIAYANRSSNTLRYAEREGTQWSIATVAPAAGQPSYISLAFDGGGAAGTPAIAFQDSGSDDLKLAWRQTSDIWSLHAVALDSEHRNAAVVFDGDSPRIFYHDQSGNAVYEARVAGELWTRTRLSTGGAHLAAARSPFNSVALIWRDNDGTIDELLI